jgi:hypothetical protein
VQRRALTFCKVKRKKLSKEMGDKKATEVDDVPGDVFKLLGEDCLRIMTQLTNIYETGD